MNPIPFNKPYLTGKEGHYIYQAVLSGKISGDGLFTKRCHDFFQNRYGFRKCLLTTSCTDALEMAAILIDIQPGDEVIVPAFTFVSTANAFVLRGANIVFADSEPNNPNMNVQQLEQLVTKKTKAIVPVHYAGIACDMDPIMELAEKYNLFVIEDAAQAVDSYYKDRPLGSIGHLAAFSFHETKNIMAGEGGMLVINDDRFIKRAEIIREKGTNRSAFFRGEIDKYGWVDVGSSFLPSDIIAAFLYAQLENLDDIQRRRKAIWNSYYEMLTPLREAGILEVPYIPPYATNNAHMFYVVCGSIVEREKLIDSFKMNSVNAVFHYQSLNKSYYCREGMLGAQQDLQHSDRYSDCLLRLPLYYELNEEGTARVLSVINKFYSKSR